MISTLIVIFLCFIISIVIYLFKVAFVRGEVFDVTLEKPRKGSKSDKYLKEVKEGIKYINDLPCLWQYIKSDDGLILAARLFENKNSNKIIILFHGYRSIAENDFASIFRWYYESGYSILLVDQRSHGRSEGKYITFGVKERYDCLRWCEYISDNFQNIDEIILGGMSMGSTTILMATMLNLPEKVKCVIADCGFTSPIDIISRVASSRYGINANILLPLINLMCMTIAKFNLYECSAIDAMKCNKLPILFIHGTSDDFVPSKMSKQNFEACNAKKKLVLIDCVTHGLAYLKNKIMVQNEIKDFLDNV